MNILETFRAARILEASWSEVDLFPTVLSRAAALALPVDAVGLSLIGHQQRVPIAASCPDAAAAEQWQFTLGEGPSYTAHHSSKPVVTGEEEMRQDWPVCRISCTRTHMCGQW